MFHAVRWQDAIVVALFLSAISSTFAADKYKLEEPVDDARIFAVGMRVDVRGSVHFPKKLDVPEIMSTQPQTASAAISYRERRLLGPGEQAESLRSARDYETAECDIKVGDAKTFTKLPDPLKVVVAQGRVDGVELYALNGLMTDDELNLIRSPADTLALIALLPTGEVEVGDKWQVPGWAFQMLTGLDAVVKGELTCSLESAEKGAATVKLNGTIEGAAVGSYTEIKVTGQLKYDLEDKYIADVDFIQSEKRSIGPISPGFDITARVRMRRQPSKSPGRLGDQKVIDDATTEPVDAAKALRFESPWNIAVQHGRHWHCCSVDEKVAKFRLMVEGNFIAECDMASIPPVKPGEHLAEAKFLADIRHSLGDRMKTLGKGEIVPSGDRKFIYRVTADGTSGERKVSWVFYLVADPTGRQASLMFTADTDVVEKLAKNDREIVDSLKFGPAPAQRAANK